MHTTLPVSTLPNFHSQLKTITNDLRTSMTSSASPSSDRAWWSPKSLDIGSSQRLNKSKSDPSWFGGNEAAALLAMMPRLERVSGGAAGRRGTMGCGAVAPELLAEKLREVLALESHFSEDESDEDEGYFGEGEEEEEDGDEEEEEGEVLEEAWGSDAPPSPAPSNDDTTPCTSPSVHPSPPRTYTHRRGEAQHRLTPSLLALISHFPAPPTPASSPPTPSCSSFPNDFSAYPNSAGSFPPLSPPSSGSVSPSS